MTKLMAGLLAVLAVSACTTVHQTEQCVETRYGKIVNPHMDNGLNSTLIDVANCFPITDLNYPETGSEAHNFEASTSDPVVVNGKVTVVYSYRNIESLYLEKRTEEAAHVQMLSALNEGITVATSRFTIDQLFGPARGTFGDSIRAIAQRKAGPNILIKQVFLRDLTPPKSIAEARVNSARKETEYAAARRQLSIDSINAAAVVLKARGDATKAELEARAIATSPEVLKLRAAEAMAAGMKDICGHASTCIIGGNIMDKWLNMGGTVRR